jgi:hypothetical protein
MKFLKNPWLRISPKREAPAGWFSSWALLRGAGKKGNNDPAVLSYHSLAVVQIIKHPTLKNTPASGKTL